MSYKRILLIAFAGITLNWLTVPSCACNNSAIGNQVSGWQQQISGTLGTTILTKFWLVGNSTSYNSGSCSINLIVNGSGYYIDPGSTDWGNACTVCSGTSAIGRTAFLYSVANSGNAQFLVMSVSPNVNGQYNYDDITNGGPNASSCYGGGNVPCPQFIPTPTIIGGPPGTSGTGAVSGYVLTDGVQSWTPGSYIGGTLYISGTSWAITGNTATTVTVTGGSAPPSGSQSYQLFFNPKLGDGSYDFTVTWPTISNVYGYYDAQPSQLITGLAVYYHAGAPSDYRITTGGWTLASGGTNSRTGYGTISATGTGSFTVHVPPPSATTYLDFSVLFDNGTPGSFTETSFVGPAVAAVAPTPAGVFAGFDAKLAMGTVTATWRSNAESGLAFYQVYASKLEGGPYVPINGTLTSPMGDSHVYTASFPFPKEIGKRKVFLKVKATDTDGTEWWTQPVKVARRG